MFTPAFWYFNAFVIVLITIDLFMHKKNEKISVKESLLTTAGWMSLAMIFCLGIYYYQGHEQALLFFTAYLVEQSLSIDNLFVFILIFKTFQIPAAHQHKILFWGILGAIVFRAVFIIVGLALIQSYGWLLYIFGVFLIFAGVKLAMEKESKIHPNKNPILLILERFIPITKDMSSGNFFAKGAMTPLFLALVVVETTDIIFALDSIPAVFAITRDPFIAYTSNIFAIMGLRSLYFSIGGLMDKFHHLHYGLALLLVFIGVKMLIEPWIHLPIPVTLGFIGSVLGLSVIASLLWPKESINN